MKVTTEEFERCEVLLAIEIEPAHVQDLLKKAAQRISRTAKIPGFRPGKAPYNVVVRRFGLETLQREALEASVEQMIKDALVEANLVPYAPVQLDSVDWDPLTIKIKVSVPPKVDLGDYRAVRLEPKAVTVTDEDVEQALKNLQERNATWTPVERPAEIGDLISMAVTQKAGDQVLAENESIDHELTAPAESERQQPDLVTPMLGLKAGDSKTFTVTYPEDFGGERYAGKEITFMVDVSGVKAKELAALDDDFARQMGDFASLADLKEKIKAELQQQRENQADFDLGAETLEKIIEQAVKIDWPLVLEEEQLDQEVKHYEQQFKQAGLTLEGYLQVENKTKEEFREDLRVRVANRLKRGLALGEVAGLEKLEVSNVEVLEQAKLIADLSGRGDQVWQNILGSEAHQNSIANELLSSKVIQRLALLARGEAPELEAEATAGAAGAVSGEAEELAAPELAAEATAGDEAPPPTGEAEAEPQAGAALSEAQPGPVVQAGVAEADTTLPEREGEADEGLTEAPPASEDEDKPDSQSTEEPITAQA